MTNNLYAAAWTIIQNCCEAAVTADLLGEPLIAHLANAAALRAAERIGIPECELRRIRQLMADDMRIGTLPRSGVDEQQDRCRRDAANANEPWSGARSALRVRPSHVDESLQLAAVDHSERSHRVEPDDAPRLERREGAAHGLDR